MSEPMAGRLPGSSMPTAIRKMKHDLRMLSQALNQLRGDEGLSRWALIVLLRAKTGLSKSVCEAVLEGLEKLIDDAFEEGEL